MASYPGSDNSWVFASSESLPVETLGPESMTGLESMMDPESDRASQALGSPSRAAAEELAGAEDGGETLLQSEGSQSGPILPEKTEAEAVLEDDGCTREPSGLGDTLVQGDLPPLWAELSRHKYRAPQGCSGVRECARQEGLAFGVELAPVQRQELASLLRTYLARLPWAGQLTKDLPLSPAYFGEDGIFRHDRLRFRDFVDALEDSLEEVAVRQTGDDDEVEGGQVEAGGLGRQEGRQAAGPQGAP